MLQLPFVELSMIVGPDAMNMLKSMKMLLIADDVQSVQYRIICSCGDSFTS